MYINFRMLVAICIAVPLAEMAQVKLSMVYRPILDYCYSLALRISFFKPS